VESISNQDEVGEGLALPQDDVLMTVPPVKELLQRKEGGESHERPEKDRRTRPHLFNGTRQHVEERAAKQRSRRKRDQREQELLQTRRG
jgi:hypothetical protein